jgi:hypothetical protein
MSIGAGDSNIRITNTLFVPYIADRDNTAFYLNPADTGNSINIAGSLRAANYNKPAIMSVSSGTSSAGASFGIQQETAEGWTGIFVDYEPYTGWGFYHDNPNNLFSFTSEGSTGQIRSFTVPSRVSGNRTAYEKLRIDQNNGDIIVGRDGYAQSSFRAPIFYDSNNTTYYIDPNSNSVIRGRLDVQAGHGNTNIRLTAIGGEMGSGVQSTMQWWVSEPGVTWNDGGFGYNVQNDGGSPSGFGRLNTGLGQAYMRFSTAGHLYFYNTNTSGTRYSTMDMYASNYIYVHNYLEAGSSLRAPIFYDSNNTGFYTDQASTSRYNEIRANKMRADTNGAMSDDQGWWTHDPYGYGWGKPHGSFRTLEVSTSGNFSTEPMLFRMHQWGSGAAEFWKPQGLTLFLRETPIGGNIKHSNWFTRFYVQRYIETDESMRAPIFYDSDNTGYYVDPTGETNWQGLTLYAKNRIGLAAKEQYRRSDYTGDTNHWTGARGWGTTSFNDQMNWGSGWGDSWGSIGQSPGDTSHYLTAQVYHYSYSGVGYGWQLTGGVTDSLWWRHSWPSNSGWFKIAMYDNNASAGGALWAGIFYDSNDSGYYLDPNTTSNAALRIRGGTLHGPNPSWGKYLAVGTNGHWTGGYASVAVTNGNLHLDSEGGYGMYLQWYVGGSTYVNGDIRANIFYDLQNTSYYCDPTGYSQFSSGEFNNYMRAARIDFIGTGGNSGQGTNAYSIFQEGGGWGYPYPDLRIAYHTGIKLGANGPSYEGTRVYTDYDMSDLAIQLCGPSNYSFKYKWMWTNDTGYYSSVNGAHWYPNNITYGAWRMDGNRNGWYGHVIDSAYLPHYMWESGNGGIYLQNAGRWVLYHSLGNNCTGLGTSATSGAYGIYVDKGVYTTGNVVAYSDRRAKENIVTIDDALSKLMQLRGVYYNRIKDEDKVRQLGVIAQEVNEIVPEVVTYAEDVDEYGVAYGNLAGLFIESIKDQQAIIDKQSEEINLLKDELQKIKDLIFNTNKG